MKVIVAYDGSTYAEAAVEDLRWAGLPKNTQAMVMFVVVHQGSREWLAENRAALAAAESIAARLQVLFPDWDVWLETPSGDPAPVIVDRARSWGADLIVMGTHGRSGFKRLVLGSVSQAVLHEAPCSVRVARGGIGRKDAPPRLVIGNDGSREGENAVDEVCRRTWSAGTEARVLAAVQTLAPADPQSFAMASHAMLASRTFLETDSQEFERCDAVAERSMKALERAGLRASRLVEENDPKYALTRQAQTWNADTIFVGARGLNAVNRFLLGSVSTALVAAAPCTVEVVRHR
jgi:nucleotide-binding universal stress UspA family protein